VRFSDIDYAALGLRGAMVDAVEPGSPADRAGLRRGDLILKVVDQPVAGPDEVLERVAAATGAVTLDLLRENRPQRLILPPAR
jgi:serine protease Do